MGMTYACYIVPKGTVDFEKHNNECYCDPLHEDIYAHGECVIDEDTFDREALGSWMGLTKDDWDFMCNYGYRFITIDHIKNAIKVLTELDEKIHKMPFNPNTKNSLNYVKNSKTGEYEYVWQGSPENYEIYKEVMNVFMKDYHFFWPWKTNMNDGYEDWGCGRYIKYLENVLEDIENALTSPDYPDGVDIVLLYF